MSFPSLSFQQSCFALQFLHHFLAYREQEIPVILFDLQDTGVKVTSLGFDFAWPFSSLARCIRFAVLFAWPFYSHACCIRLAVLFACPLHSPGRFTRLAVLFACALHSSVPFRKFLFQPRFRKFTSFLPVGRIIS